MDALSYGALVASELKQAPHPAYDSVDDDDTEATSKMARFDGDDTFDYHWNGTMAPSDAAENNAGPSFLNNSFPASNIPTKRPRGRPRKLNPDGSFATNHTPLSHNLKTMQFNRRYATDHPRNIIPQLCQQMFKLGWMTGTAGSMTIKQNKEIYITPSGVLKERLLPQDLFVLDEHGNLLDCPNQEKNLRMTDNAIVFLQIYSMRDAGAIIHSHSPKAVLATLLFKGKEFQISNLEMIKGMKKGNTGKRYQNHETLVIPIIENLPSEKDLAPPVTTAMEQYPLSNAVLIRRHGLYVWGDTWTSAKAQAECLEYLFDLAIEMHRSGIDLSAGTSKETPITE